MGHEGEVQGKSVDVESAKKKTVPEISGFAKSRT